jgi:hypothetical protein
LNAGRGRNPPVEKNAARNCKDIGLAGIGRTDTEDYRKRSK